MSNTLSEAIGAIPSQHLFLFPRIFQHVLLYMNLGNPSCPLLFYIGANDVTMLNSLPRRIKCAFPENRYNNASKTAAELRSELLRVLKPSKYCNCNICQKYLQSN